MNSSVSWPTQPLCVEHLITLSEVNLKEHFLVIDTDWFKTKTVVGQKLSIAFNKTKQSLIFKILK